jgi:putative transposase
MIEPKHANLSISRQCDLLDLPRSSYYSRPTALDEKTLQLGALIDEEFARHPFLGTRRMCQYMKSLGYTVNRKRMKKLYHQLHLQAVFPKKSINQANKNHPQFPYLLRGVRTHYS